jgi:poly(3-hydroxybutyrate) depolymerase
MSHVESFALTDEHWTTPHWVAYEDGAIRVLQFGAADIRRDRRATPLLIVPPQAGHHSAIADYGPGQSLVECALQASDAAVYAIEWKSCSWDRRHEGISDLLAQLARAVEVVGGRCHLVGLCQGGWLAAIHAALHPASAASLTIAGAPIDTQAGESVLHRITRLPYMMFQSLVLWGGGLMRGQLMLTGWKAGNPYQHYVERYRRDDPATERFYRWYDYTQDLAGGWYLWAIERLFQRNELGRNELEIAGRHVDLAALEQLPAVHVVVGSRDDITPPEQSLALLRHARASVHRVDAGHIGVFMGSAGIRNTWAPLFGGLEGAV